VPSSFKMELPKKAADKAAFWSVFKLVNFVTHAFISKIFGLSRKNETILVEDREEKTVRFPPFMEPHGLPRRSLDLWNSGVSAPG